MQNYKWITVARKHPCPICKKPDWCGVSEDGELCICMRVQSGKESRNGGWIHILNEPIPEYKYIPPQEIKKKAPSIIGDMVTAWRTGATPGAINGLASDLEVDVSALRRLDVVWAPEHTAWGFPMRNEKEQITGIRLRNKKGQKWAVTGSRSGLFIPAGLGSKTLLIVEGPTDTAAGLTLGFDVIGRPSCRGQEELVRKWLQKHRYDEIVLLVDNDKPDKNTGKRPGFEGAKKLAVVLNRPVKLIRTPVKDIRQWLSCGLDSIQLGNVIKNTKPKIFKE